MNKFVVSMFASFLLACSGTPTGPGIGGEDGRSGGDGDNGSDGASGLSGSDGTTGAAGTDGANGKDGTDNRITKTWKCDFVIARFSPEPGPLGGPTGCTDTAIKVSGWYYATETTAGDTFVRVGVDHVSSSGYPAVGSSSSYFWAAGTWEANNGANWLLQDICSGSHFPPPASANGNWAFLLNKQTNVMTATYADVDVVNGKIVVETNCSVK